MRQHYLLGTSIRNKYKNFISNEFNPNEIYVISSDVNRTLISAYSNLLGIFHNNNANINNKGFINNHNYSDIINDYLLNEKEQLQYMFPINIYKGESFISETALPSLNSNK